MNNPNFNLGTANAHPDTGEAAADQHNRLMQGVVSITQALERQFGPEIANLVGLRLQPEEVVANDEPADDFDQLAA